MGQSLPEILHNRVDCVPNGMKTDRATKPAKMGQPVLCTCNGQALLFQCVFLGIEANGL
jgi:hypothetical protein